MDAWSILAIVLSLAVIALVGFVIPVLIQLKDVLKSVEINVNRLEKEFEPVLQHVEGITGNFEGLTEAANSFVHRRKEVSDQPGMMDNLKHNVIEKKEALMHNVSEKKEALVHNVIEKKEVIKEYIPVVKSEVNRYINALNTGVKVGVENFRQTSHTTAEPSQAQSLLTTSSDTQQTTELGVETKENILR